VDIRTILYVHVYLLIGISVGLLVIARRHPHARELRWMAVSSAAGAMSTVLRVADTHIPRLFSILLANLLLLLSFVLIHRCFEAFVAVRLRARSLGVLLVGAGMAGLAYFTYADENIVIRSLILSLTCFALALLNSATLLGCRDAAVRTPCVATAGLYVMFALTAAMRCLGVLFHDTPREYFAGSVSNLIGLLGFEILIVGVPLGYFWMSSARLWSNQNKLARTDSLTGLPNRRALEEWGTAAAGRGRAQRTPLALLVLDVDHFKRINDHYGHKGGDLALRALSRLLAGAVRREDLVARLGGEEFVILLWNQSMESALATAERIRKLVEELEIVVEDHVLRATISSGVAVFGVDDVFDDVLRRADRALYAAKLAGRNCVRWEATLSLGVRRAGCDELREVPGATA
jgi:diguanylate cyclase (GGDEF)-like protein